MGRYASRVRAAFAELPERLTRDEARTLCVERLADALEIAPASIRARWTARKLVVEVPTRMHYADESDAIMESIEEVVTRVDILDVHQLGPDEFTEELRRLRDGDA